MAQSNLHFQAIDALDKRPHVFLLILIAVEAAGQRIDNDEFGPLASERVFAGLSVVLIDRPLRTPIDRFTNPTSISRFMSWESGKQRIGSVMEPDVNPCRMQLVLLGPRPEPAAPCLRPLQPRCRPHESGIPDGVSMPGDALSRQTRQDLPRRTT